MKICSKCKIEKSLDNFWKDITNKDGYYYSCKQCKSVWTKENRNGNPIYREKRIKRRAENIERISKQVREYTKKHRKHLNECRNILRNEKWKNDPGYKFKTLFSSYIRRALKKVGKIKSSPTWYKLPYTIQELKEHLESKFEYWMSWENHGIYDINKKTWQIDHIIPQSILFYDSMEHPNFLECWSLKNLRPLDTIENMKKSNKTLEGLKNE